MLAAVRVAQGIYQGPCPRSAEEVRRNGFHVLTFCALEIQPMIHDPQGLRVLYAPMNDNPMNPMSEEEWTSAQRAGREIALLTSTGGRALTTCAMGLNRSGIVNALALHYRFGVTGVEAIDQVRRTRGPMALSNPSFVERLRRLPARVS
jgi:protein-tyrosine phosphatase